MLRWALLGFMLLVLGINSSGMSLVYASEPVNKQNSTHKKKTLKKKKRQYKKKKNKKKSHKRKKSKRHRFKGKQYCVKKIEKLLKNDQKDGFCNRLNCASDISVAKTCLSSRKARTTHRSCFRAFCAYGCNDDDYANKPEVFAFCNRICSSKRYEWMRKRG